MQKKNAAVYGGTQKRVGTAPRKISAPAGVDREIALSLGVFRKNAAFVKSVSGKPNKLSDTTLYIAADASGFAGIQPILDSNTKKMVGITNFDGNTLNTGRNIVINGVRLMYTTDGDSVKSADWQNNDRLPAELQNAEVVMKQGGEQIFAMPLTDLQGYKYDDWRKVTDRPFVRNNEPISIELQIPSEVTVPLATATVKQFIRFEFRVTQSKS